jgi:hypothetical protein
MLKKLVLPIIVFASVATASMTSNITAFAQDNRTENTAKEFFAKQPCDVLPKMMDVVKGYKEELLFMGEGMSFAAQSGKGFMGGMMFFTNQDTGTWSMLQLYGDGTACLVINGRGFVPYSGPTIPEGIEH